jgi:hypothetical protein
MRITSLLIWSLLIVNCSFAAVIGETNDPLLIGGGARPLGMGRAFTAVVEDADAAFINPAGLAGLRAPEAMSMFTNLLGDIYYMEFSGAVPSRFGAVGLGYITTGVNGVLVPIGSSFVTSDYYDNLLVLTYSTPLASLLDFGQGIYVGVNAKLFNRGWAGLANQSASGVSADFGIKYVASPYLSFGLTRQNILPIDLGGVVHYSSGAEEAIAGLNKVGIAVRPKPWFDKLLLAGDVDIPAQSGRPVTAHLGAEWKLNDLFSVRAGADQSPDASSPSLTSWNPTFGLSLGSSGFRFDYAYHPYYNDPAYAASYVSFSYRAEDWSSLTGETQ